MATTVELDVGGEHDVFVLAAALGTLRAQYIYRSKDPTEVTGAPFLEWAAAAENLRLQVQDKMLTLDMYPAGRVPKHG